MELPDKHLAYLRHNRGGGRLFDESEACERSFVDRASVIKDESSVWQSKIVASKIIEQSVVTNAVIERSIVAATVFSGGTARDSLIACELVSGNVRIENSRVTGKSRVCHTARLFNVRVKNLTVKGNARLIDWGDKEIDFHHGYISRGIWRRPPRVFRVSATITVTESVPGFAFVHCRELPLTKWLRIGNRYGAACNWTRDEILATRKIFHFLIKEQERNSTL